jgi:DNA-binding beta-propeller fold protein YncE
MRPLVLLLLVSASAPAASLDRFLYVAEDKGGVSVYDINRNHQFVRKIEIPETGGFKGICASVQLGRLYLSSNKKDDLIALDLKTEKVIWRKNLGKYADSMAITPDGQLMYVPFRDEDNWKVVRATDGEVVATIPIARGKNYEDGWPIGSIGPHNTWMHPSGKRVYFEVLTEPWIWVVDTASNQVLGKVGPFSKGIRPFAVTDDEKYVFVNVDRLLGFEVGAVKDGDKWGGKMLHRVETQTPKRRLEEYPNPPARKPHSTLSHGINLTPDQSEVWIVDGIYGWVYAFDVRKMPPRFITGVPLYADPSERPKPGWISFSIDGKYAYPDGGAVIDVKAKKVVARIPTSEKLIEVDFAGGAPVKAGHR